MHGDPQDANEAITKLRLKRKVDCGEARDGRNAEIGERHDTHRENRNSREIREREDSDDSQHDGMSVTPMETGAITSYECKKKKRGVESGTVHDARRKVHEEVQQTCPGLLR